MFCYKARKTPGSLVSGKVEASNPDLAASRIWDMGYVPVEIIPETRKKECLRARFFKNTVTFPGIGLKAQVIDMTGHLADILDSGVPMARALCFVEDQAHSSGMREVVKSIREAVVKGSAFSDAVAASPLFSPVYISLIRAGESSGCLKEALRHLAEHMEHEKNMMARVRASLVYPLIVLCTSCLTFAVLLIWVIPRVTALTEDMGGHLPWATRFLIAASRSFPVWGSLFLIIFVSAFVVLKRTRGTFRGDHWKFRIPVWGQFIRHAQSSCFAGTLGALLENGVDLMTALRSVSSVMDNAVLREAACRVSQKVGEGMSLHKAISQQNIFPDFLKDMVAVGEETGRLHEVLGQAAVYYEKKVDQMRQGLLAFLEPGLILVMGSAVGFIVLALLMPIFRMNSLIGF